MYNMKTIERDNVQPTNSRITERYKLRNENCLVNEPFSAIPRSLPEWVDSAVISYKHGNSTFGRDKVDLNKYNKHSKVIKPCRFSQR